MNGVKYYMIKRKLAVGDVIIEAGIEQRYADELVRLDENSTIKAECIIRLSEYFNIPIEELLRQDYEMEERYVYKH